jgi:hypothetical protein
MNAPEHRLRTPNRLSPARCGLLVWLATAVVVLTSALPPPPASSQVPPSRLRGIDIYRTAQFDEAAFERRLEPAIVEFIAAVSANDNAAIERIAEYIRSEVEASGEFAYMSFSMTTSWESDANVVDITIELVDPEDASTRLNFGPAPTGIVDDPGGVLAAWADYQQTALELVNTRQMEPTLAVEDCPALHCVFGYTHERLAPFLDRFDRSAREHHDVLLEVLREDADPEKRKNAVFVLAHGNDAAQLLQEIVPSLDDPDSGVRNNVMRVMLNMVLRDDTIEIPFESIARRIDDPEGDCRNKASQLIAAVSHRPEYRDDILAILPGILRLLRLDKPNTHDPAYRILTTVSGEDFAERDYASWQAWVARAL